MSSVSHFTSSGETSTAAVVNSFNRNSNWRKSTTSTASRISMPLQSRRLRVGIGNCSKANARSSVIRMALVDERTASNGTNVSEPPSPVGVLAYDLVQGALVKWSSAMDKSMPDPPTAVLLHGILGSRKNWVTFTRRLAREFPMWQFLLVDLRCHGDSAATNKRRPHTVASTALDVLKLVCNFSALPTNSFA